MVKETIEVEEGRGDPSVPESPTMDLDPLLRPIIIEGAVDHRGRPVSRSNSGGWTSALFIIGVEIAERFAYYGISSNLIMYLTGPLGENTAAAAANVNAWYGVSWMLPLPLGFAADAWFGRYRTIVGASLLYLLGLGMLTLSTVAPSFRPPKCIDGTTCSPTNFQIAFFFSSIYLIAFAQGGHKPCVQAFGADQFDENDPEECKSKSSFFNWWYFGICSGTVVTILILNYVQDNIGWGLGFGIPFASMFLALSIFLLGTKTYRYYVRPNRRPFMKIGQAVEKLTISGQNQSDTAKKSVLVGVEGEGETQPLLIEQSRSASKQTGREDWKELLKLFPMWATCLVYAVVFAQSSTFFTKQGSTMDRRIGPTLKVPPAALQSFISLAVVAFIPIYDPVLVPVARKFSGSPSGLTMLQRIGVGIFLSVVSMVVAALVEIKRLQTARDFGLIDLPKATIPMSFWWLVPQYILFGVADVFTMVGLQEFFYDQVPSRLRSLGLALYLSIFGIGSFISSFLVSVIDKASSRSGESWLSNNLNRGHLDYFYWLLAGLSAGQFLIYLYLSQAYLYKKAITNT